MKKLLIIFAFIVLFVGQAWGANIYVSQDTDIGGAEGSQKIWYKTDGWPSSGDNDANDTDIEAALTATGAGGTLYLYEGTYSGTEIDATTGIHPKASNQTITGIGTVIIDATGINDHGIHNSQNAVTINNLTLKTKAGYWAYYGTILNSTDLTIQANGMGINVNGAGINTRMKLYSLAGEYSVRVSNGNPVFNCSIFNKLATPIFLSAGNPVFNNCMITGTYNANVYTATVLITPTTYTGNAVLNNNIFTANVVDGIKDQYIINNASTSGGTVTLNSPMLVQAPKGKITNGVTINNPVYDDPKFVSARRPSYVTLSVDDEASVETFKSLASYTGSGVTYFIDSDIDSISDADWIIIGNLVDQGHEVGGHTFAHTQLTVENAITIASSRTVPTVEISTTQTDDDPSNWTGSMVLKEDGSTIATYDFTDGSYTYLWQLKAAIELNTGWTVSYPTGSSTAAKARMLKIATQSVAGAGYTFVWENNLVGETPVQRYWYHEIVYHKKILEDKMALVLSRAYPLRSFAWPGGNYNATLKTFVSTQSNYDPLGVTKYLGARNADALSGGSYTLASDYTSGSGPATGIQIYELSGPHLSVNIGTTNPDRFAIAYNQWSSYIGGYFVFYTHSFGEYNEANSKLFIDGLKQNPSISLITMGDMLTNITTSGLWADADADGKRWTRTFADEADYSLKPNSPCRNGAVYTPGYTTRLKPECGDGSCSNTMEDILSIGAYGVFRGAAGM